MFNKKMKFHKITNIIKLLNDQQSKNEDNYEYYYEIGKVCDEIEDINRLIMMFGSYTSFPTKDQVHAKLTDAEIDRVYR